MRVLVTGASGLFGAHAMELLSSEHEVLGLDRHPWWGDVPRTIVEGDLLDESFTTRMVREFLPDVVIHAAALANVDLCEEQPLLAERYNVGMTRALARAAGPSCLFVYITTDGIFDGERSNSTESQDAAPRTVYGRTKYAGELEVQSASPDHLILRTNFYGWSSGRKSTSAEWLYDALVEQRPISLFEDFYFTPLYVVDFVTRIRSLMATPHRGVFHVCGSERISKYDFGVKMAELAGLSLTGVSRGSIERAALKAPRPKDMSLNSDRVVAATGGLPMPDVAAGIHSFLSHHSIPLSRRFHPAATTD